jgi:hypothetical protein
LVRRAIIGALLIGVVLGVCATTAVAGPAGVARPKFYQKNLLNNFSAEDGVAAPDMRYIVKPSGWATSRDFTVVQYGDPSGLPDPENRQHPFGYGHLGHNFFAGGPNADESQAWQNVDISRGEKDIDRASARGRPVRFIMTAYLGGRLAQPSYGLVYVRFFSDRADKANPKFCELDQEPCYVLGPVSRSMRQSMSTLIELRCSGDVPAGARSAMVSMYAKRVSGTDNLAFFDNLSFELIDPRTPTATPRGPDLEVPRCRTGVAQAEAAADVFKPDDRTSSCRWPPLLGIMLVLAFLCGSLVFAFFATYLGRLDRCALALGAGVVGAGAVAALVRFENVFHLADIGCLSEQPWAPSAVKCAAFTAFIVAMTGYLALCDQPFAQTWKRRLLVADTFLASFVAVLAVIRLFAVQIDELERIDAELVLVSSGLFLVVFIIRLQKPTTPLWIKAAVLASLYLPIYFASVAFENLREIKLDRLRAEERQAYFDLLPVRDSGKVHLQNTIFFTPDSLAKDESAQVVFAANIAAPADATGCLVGRLDAPGFDLRNAPLKSTSLASPALHWHWPIKAERSGRQLVSISVTTGECGRVATASLAPANEHEIFQQDGKIWVFSSAIAFNDLSSTVPFLGLLVSVGTLAYYHADFRLRNPPARPPARSPANPPAPKLLRPSPGPPKPRDRQPDSRRRKRRGRT